MTNIKDITSKDNIKISEVIDLFKTYYDNLEYEITVRPQRKMISPEEYSVYRKRTKVEFQTRKHTDFNYKNTSSTERFVDNKMLRSKSAAMWYSHPMMLEFYKCRNDIVYFAKNYVFIVSDEKLKRYRPRDYQIEFLRNCQDFRYNISCQARQTGKSICTAIFVAWMVTFYNYKRIGLISKDLTSSENILKNVVTVLENLPDFISVGVVRKTKSNIVFENGSSIDVHSSTKDSVRGNTYSLVDHYIITSTPNGKDHFHKLFDKAKFYNELDEEQKKFPKEVECFIRTKAIWNEVPDLVYTRKLLSEEGINKFVCNQSHSSKFASSMIDKIGLQKFKQEYECSFTSTANSILDENEIDKIRSHCTTEFDYDFNEQVKVFEEPIEGATYVMSVDPSEGVKDSTSISVFKIENDTFELVASYCERCEVNQGLDIISGIYDSYNSLVVCERNAIGLLYTSKLNDYEVHQYLSKDGKQGIRTSKGVRKSSVDTLKKHLTDGKIIIRDYEYIDELETFVMSDSNHYRASENHHDDRVMSMVILSSAINEGRLHEQTEPLESSNDYDYDYSVVWEDDYDDRIYGFY